MVKGEFKEVDGFLVSGCGRIFKEVKYDHRGSKYKRYKCFRFNGRRVDVHRFLAEKLIPNPENKPWVLHINDDATDNSIGNLKWGTPKENSADALKNGRFKKSAMRKKKFKEERLNTLLEFLKQGVPYKEITAIFPVSRPRISQMVRQLKDSGRL